MRTKTITFSLFDPGDGDNGQMSNPTDVKASNDGRGMGDGHANTSAEVGISMRYAEILG